MNISDGCLSLLELSSDMSISDGCWKVVFEFTSTAKKETKKVYII
jgi:hypothetical protein